MECSECNYCWQNENDTYLIGTAKMKLLVNGKMKMIIMTIN